jgi:capsular polysaccharide biosynthesis protein
MMDEQLRIILIIIVSVSIFGLLVFVFVKNYIRNKINILVEENKKNKKKENN